MPYDQELAHRIRELLGVDARVREKAMFGGLAFLVEGRMAIAVSGRGGVLVRVGRAESDRLLRKMQAEVAVMGDRPMTGWLRVAPEHLATTRQLGTWVRLGVDYAASLADEPGGRRRRGSGRSG